MEALNNYYDEAENRAKHMEETVGNALKGLEDQLVSLFSGGKFDAEALFKSITTDLTRNMVKEQITGPLSDILKDFLGGSGGNALSDLLGGGKNAGASAAQAALATSASAATTAITALASAAAAASAMGGSSVSSLLGSGGGSGDGLGDLIKAFGGFAGFSSGGYTGTAASSSLPALCTRTSTSSAPTRRAAWAGPS